MEPRENESTKIQELNRCYTEGESCDKDLFAEMRSNLLLVSGDHYARRYATTFENIRSRTDIPLETRIRIVKNHTQKISKIYVNFILSSAPGVTIVPNSESELKDKKSAELREILWRNTRRSLRINEKIRDWCEDFVNIGEVGVKVVFDPDAGSFVGYRAEVDEFGEDLVDEMGELVASDQAEFSGEFQFKRFFGFNLIRPPEAQSMEDAQWLILRDMVDVSLLRKKYQGDEKKLKFIQDEEKRTFMVFDAIKGTYSRSRGQCMVREHYYRPSPMYPMGYYYIATEAGILEEGELPLGIWPLAWAAYEKIPTAPRGRSPVKHMRPFQIEINRSASKIAEHQVTLGDDKVIYQAGTKMEYGGMLPGIRGVKVSGSDPKVLPGRNGAQYLETNQATITELYNVMGVDETMADKMGEVDPYALLFRSASQKKQFVTNIQRFEQFLIDVVTIFLKLAPHYYSDDQLLRLIGSDEVDNLVELRNTEDLNYQVAVEPQAQDLESRLGQQLVLNQILQYMGSKLEREDIGRLVAQMPFLGKDTMFSDLTMDADLADNVLLALDRGEPPMVHTEDNHAYMIKRLTTRMRMPDFKLLTPQAQQNYRTSVSLHEQGASEQQARTLAIQNDLIPTGGGLIACDVYVPDPKNPLSSKRLRMPQQALLWTYERLIAQGQWTDQMDKLPPEQGMNVMEQAMQRAAQIPPGQTPANPVRGAPGIQAPQTLGASLQA